MAGCQVEIFPTPAGDIVRYTLTNASGASVTLQNIGAGIASIRVPDRNGRLGEVALGYADPASWLADGPCAGKTPGRVANRIAAAQFTLDGRICRLPRNDGRNTLHGGPHGFAERLWSSRKKGENSVEFTLLSPDGDNGFPGNLRVTVSYTWTDDNRLQIRFEAISDALTPVNLTNHTYFNLDGAGSGYAPGQLLRLNSDEFLPITEEHLPQGRIAPVEGTAMDFRDLHPVDYRFGAGGDFCSEPQLKIARGFNHCWAIRGWKEAMATGCLRELTPVAELIGSASGRRLEILSTNPGVQVYTGGWLEGSPANRSGRSYNNHDGIAFECQGFTDACNHPEYPPSVASPCAPYRREIEFRFSTI